MNGFDVKITSLSTESGTRILESLSGTTSAQTVSNLQIFKLTYSDYVQIYSTLLLAIIALITPFIAEWFRRKYRAPVLKIRFNMSPPDCHITQMRGDNINFPVYYFRFLVENVGKTQADDCEVYLEKIARKRNDGEIEKFTNFTPLNLKWSGMREPLNRNIQPGKTTFCDIGRIQHPDFRFESVYRGISENEISLNKFIFELPERYYSQWDCLVPGNYILTVSVYSKNAEKVTRDFHIKWTGNWKDGEQEMFKEIVIS